MPSRPAWLKHGLTPGCRASRPPTLTHLIPTPNKGSHMSENPNVITIDNSAMVLIDQQPWVAFSVPAIDRSQLVNNVTGLAVATKAVGILTLMTTVGAHRGPLADPMFHQISEVFPDQTPIDRVSTNA
jgi:hypothetical protein